MNTRQQTTLIIGGTGKTVRRMAERLSTRGLPVRIASRSTEPPFDWNDEETWAPAQRSTEASWRQKGARA